MQHGNRTTDPSLPSPESRRMPHWWRCADLYIQAPLLLIYPTVLLALLLTNNFLDIPGRFSVTLWINFGIAGLYFLTCWQHFSALTYMIFARGKDRWWYVGITVLWYGFIVRPVFASQSEELIPRLILTALLLSMYYLFLTYRSYRRV